MIWGYPYFKATLANHNLFIGHLRYVGNRLVFGDKRLRELPACDVRLNDSFCGRPVVPETEKDQDFLGFLLETNPIPTYRRCSHPFRHRHLVFC